MSTFIRVTLNFRLLLTGLHVRKTALRMNVPNISSVASGFEIKLLHYKHTLYK